MMYYYCGMDDETRKQRRNAYMREYRAKNREKIAEYSRGYMRKARVVKPEQAQAAAVRAYDKNAARLRAEQRERLNALKAKPCADCGIAYPPYVMQFDHRNPDEKLFPIDASAMHRASAKLEAELDKCDLVCANCHAERTHQQRLAGHRFGGAPRTRPRKQEVSP